MFRRKQAIATFDWPFTPNQESYQYIATDKDSTVKLYIRKLSVCS